MQAVTRLLSLGWPGRELAATHKVACAVQVGPQEGVLHAAGNAGGAQGAAAGGFLDIQSQGLHRCMTEEQLRDKLKEWPWSSVAGPGAYWRKQDGSVPMKAQQCRACQTCPQQCKPPPAQLRGMDPAHGPRMSIEQLARLPAAAAVAAVASPQPAPVPSKAGAARVPAERPCVHDLPWRSGGCGDPPELLGGPGRRGPRGCRPTQR